MNLIAFRCAIALLTFIIGCATAHLSFQRLKVFDRGNKARQLRQARIRLRSKEEERIVETIFRHQMAQQQADCLCTKHFILSRADGTDPADGLLRRLRYSGFDVNNISSILNDHRSIWDQYPAGGLILRVGQISWLGESEVTVGGACHPLFGQGTEAYTLRLKSRNGEWIVVESELLT